MKTLRAAPAFALAVALAAAQAYAAPDAGPAREALSGVHARFIEAPMGAGFVVRGAARSIGFTKAGVASREAAGTIAYEFKDANLVAPEGVSPSGMRYHVLVGDRSAWATDLRSFGAVAYRGLWSGIDATWSGDRAGLKYSFTVRPGADPAKIAFTLRGADEARIAADGALELRVGSSWMRDDVPVAFQPGEGGDRLVKAGYRLEPSGEGAWTLGFTLGDYDRAKVLEVDPAWTVFTGLVGGNAADQVYGVARDAAGNSYACGLTASLDLPVTAGFTTLPASDTNAFLVKFNAAGVPQFATYLGGNGFDTCNALAVDAAGAIYLGGGTQSTNFPVAGAADTSLKRSKATADRDGFVTKLGADGKTLAWSGYVGGLSDDQVNALAVDAQQRVYVTGYSRCTGPNCPIDIGAKVGPRLTHGQGSSASAFASDPFVGRIAANGVTFEYLGFLGGNGDYDIGHGIAVKSTGEAVVVGETDSTTGLPAPATSFRSTAGSGTDGFVAVIAADGTAVTAFSRLTGTGGSGVSRALAVAVDPADNTIAVAGETSVNAFPADNTNTRLGTGPQATLGGRMDGFVVRLAANGGSVLSSTYLGGAAFDSAEAVAADGAGGVYVAGTTAFETPNTFPIVATAGLSNTRFKGQDGFVASLRTASPGTFAYSGFIGAADQVGDPTLNDALHAIAAAPSVATSLILGGVTTGLATRFTAPNGGALSGGAAVGSPNGLLVRLDAGTLAVDSGTPQSTAIGTAFATPLRVRLTSPTNAAQGGVTVTFTAPGSGASATLSAATAVTDPAGFASVNATANGVIGGYNVVASSPGFANVSFALTNQSFTTTTVQSSLPSVTLGSPITFTATVVGSSPTGTVAFTEGANTLCAAVALAAGQAQCTTSALAAGTRTITATYSGNTLNRPSSGTSTVTVTVAAGILTVVPSSLDFGVQSLATTSPAKFVVLSNTGSAPLTINQVSASRTEYGAAHGCATLNPGEACSIAVIFTPSAVGAQPGTVTITHTAPGSPSTVTLAGSGERSLVTHYYQSILGREPDPSGKVFWESEATRMQSLGASPSDVWLAMTSSFFASAEYAGRGRDDSGFVADLYATYFNRAPDAGGLAFWSGQIAGGLPRDAVRAQFMFSTEFANFITAIFGPGAARAELTVVDDLFRGFLARLPANAGISYWMGPIRTAQCAPNAAPVIAAQLNALAGALANSAEYAARHRTNSQYVVDLFDAYLRRPGAITGIQYWTQALDSNSITREGLRQVFVDSAEFAGRVNAVVTQGCLPP